MHILELAGGEQELIQIRPRVEYSKIFEVVFKVNKALTRKPSIHQQTQIYTKARIQV